MSDILFNYGHEMNFLSIIYMSCNIYLSSYWLSLIPVELSRINVTITRKNRRKNILARFFYEYHKDEVNREVKILLILFCW